MPSKRVLVIGGKKKLLQRAKALGIESLYVQKPEKLDPSITAHADYVVPVNYQSLETFLPILETIFSERPFQLAISMSEDGLLPAATVNARYGLGGASLITVHLLRDKWAMRCRLNSLGISQVAAREGSTLHDLKQFLLEHGGPLIVKPVDGTASVGVFLAGCVEDANEIWKELQELRSGRFIMEEYLTGPEISVESFSFAGRHVVLGITDKV